VKSPANPTNAVGGSFILSLHNDAPKGPVLHLLSPARGARGLRRCKSNGGGPIFVGWI